MTRAALTFLVAISVSMVAAACSSVNIQTGPPTEEESAHRSSVQARDLKSEWHRRLDAAGAMDKIRLVQMFIDTTANRYIRYGRNVTTMWEKENDRLGRDIPAAEIMQAVESSTAVDRPMIDAQEDVMEYGVEEVLRTDYFDDETEGLLNQMRQLYLEAYSAAFLPSVGVTEYRYRLDDVESELADISDLLSRDISRY